MRQLACRASEFYKRFFIPLAIPYSMRISTLHGWLLLALALLAGTARAQHIAVGGSHTLAVHADGSLWA